MSGNQKEQFAVAPNQLERPDEFDNENLVNAFDLLLRIDMRINPQNYIVQKNSQSQND